MTKKHFKAIAKILSQNIGVKWTSEQATALDIADDLAVYFKQENPLFDKARFMKACGKM